MIVTEKSELNKGRVLIEFYADWCGPCKITKPIVEQFGNSSKDVKVYFCNVDEDFTLAAEHGVRGVPTMVYVVDGEVKNRKVGMAQLADIQQLTNS
jgi:thioredoxin 1